MLGAHAADPEAVDALADLLAEASAPALVVGAGADEPDAWAALVALAERLDAPVFQESFGARAGFPQDHPLFAGHVLAALAERLPRDAVVIEETPSSRPELHARVPAREPLGFLSAAMGGLGFALPAAIGLRMGRPDRPVVAVVGDGSSLYQIQALWSAAHYGVGALFVILANGRYAIMDRLAEATGDAGPWPAFEAVDVAGIARGLGCPATTVEDHETLLSTLDEVLPGLAERCEPLMLEVVVAPDATFEP